MSITEQGQFKVNGRAVINMPGNTFYHNQVVRILKLFPHANSFAARVRFESGGERTLTLDKLQPFTPYAASIVTRSLQTVESHDVESQPPKLPGWAWQGTTLRQGCDLKAGDTVYFSAKANPRILDYPVSAGEWKGWAVSGSQRYSTSIYITPSRWYVVKAVK